MDNCSVVRIPRNRFGNDTALACVHSALSLLDVLPDEASEDWFHRTAPWWTMLHFLMQAATVLLIQLAVGAVPVRTEQGIEEGINEAASPDAVLWSCKKALFGCTTWQGKTWPVGVVSNSAIVFSVA